MNAIILSAGLGTRLKPLTNTTPKPMIKVGGKPVLEYLIKYLRRYGIENIIVNLHHLPLKIMKHFGSSVLYTYEPELLGEEKTIENLADKFSFIRNNYLVVMNGDTLTNLDLNTMMELSKGKSIQSVDKGVYTGVKILSPDYFMGNKKIINYSSTNTRWIDIGTLEGLKKAREEYSLYEKFNNLWKLSN